MKRKKLAMPTELEKLIQLKLTENNGILFNYLEKKFTDLKEEFGYKAKLKDWKKDLFKFSMEHNP